MVTKRYPQHRPPVADRGWERSFDDPIQLPRGRQLITLEDAGNYITKLPKAEHETKEWQAAMEALILVATHGGPTMLARIADVHLATMSKPDTESQSLLTQRAFRPPHRFDDFLYGRSRFRVSTQFSNVSFGVHDPGTLLCCLLCSFLRHFKSFVLEFASPSTSKCAKCDSLGNGLQLDG
jgi:hypothetical protein